MSTERKISAVVIVGSRVGDLAALHQEYRKALSEASDDYEIIYVVDGDRSGCSGFLEKLDGAPRVVKLSRSFGKATALSVALEQASGDVLLTLPAYRQVDNAEIGRILEAKRHNPMVVGRRRMDTVPSLQRLKGNIFHGIVSRFTGARFHDLGCEVRAFDRQIIERIPLYGGNFRFLPVLAVRSGYRVAEVPLTEGDESGGDLFRPWGHLNSLLDVMTIFFLTRFTKRPLRFFGVSGAATFFVGFAVVAVTVAERLLWDVPLSERPALLLGSLLSVLGIQIGALGLIGELIIFTHAKDLKEYNVETVLNPAEPASDVQQSESVVHAHVETGRSGQPGWST